MLKVGMRVKQLKSSEFYHQSGELKGTIIRINNNDKYPYGVRWDDGVSDYGYNDQHLVITKGKSKLPLVIAPIPLSEGSSYEVKFNTNDKKVLSLSVGCQTITKAKFMQIGRKAKWIK